MMSTHCLLLLGLLVASGYGHTSAMSDDDNNQVQAFPSHYIIQNPTDGVSYSDDTCVSNGPGVFCSRGRKKSPILMDCGLGPEDSIPHGTQAYILQNRRPMPYTFNIAFYFNEPFTLDSVLLFYYYNRRCFNVSLKIDSTPLTMKKCSTNFNSGANQRKQSVININEDFDLEIDRPLVVEIRLPRNSVLKLTEVMFFKKGSGDGIITEPVKVDGPVINNTNNFVFCSASASSCGIIWKWEHKSQTPINNINIKDDRVILPDEDQMIFKSSLFREQMDNYSCTAMRQYVKKEVEEDGDYCCFVVNDNADDAPTTSADYVPTSPADYALTTPADYTLTTPAPAPTHPSTPGNNNIVLIGVLFGTLAALMLCILIALTIIIACVALVCYRRRSKPGGKDEAVTIANPAYSLGAIVPSITQENGAFEEPQYAVPDDPCIHQTSRTTQGLAHTVPERPIPPNAQTPMTHEYEDDDSSDPAHTKEQDPISYEVLVIKQDPHYSHLNHNTRPTESPDPTYSHLSHTGGPAETGPDPATIHLDSDKEQDPLPYEVPVKKQDPTLTYTKNQ